MNDTDFGIAYIKQNSGNSVKVTMNEYRDRKYIHIREYMLDGDTGVSFPTKSGYAIEADELDSVIDLLEQASKKLGKMYADFRQLSFDL